MSISLFLSSDLTLLDRCARTVLFFDSAAFIALTMVIGFLALPRAHRHFAHLVLLTFSMMVLNTLMKQWFAVPLAVSLGKAGYAFPSGHMQFATAFYVWLMFMDISRWLKAAMVLILVLIAPAMIHFGYHNWSDIAAGSAVGAGSAALYWIVLCRLRAQHIPETTLGTAIVFWNIGLMSLMGYWLGFGGIPAHAWMGFYITLGFALTWRQIIETHNRRWSGMLLGVGFSVMATMLAKELRYVHATHVAFSQLPYLMVGLVLPMIQAWQSRRAGN